MVWRSWPDGSGVSKVTVIVDPARLLGMVRALSSVLEAVLNGNVSVKAAHPPSCIGHSAPKTATQGQTATSTQMRSSRVQIDVGGCNSSSKNLHATGGHEGCSRIFKQHLHGRRYTACIFGAAWNTAAWNTACGIKRLAAEVVKPVSIALLQPFV